MTGKPPAPPAPKAADSDEEASPEGSIVRLLAEYLRPHRRTLALTVVLQIIGTIASLYVPTLNADLVNHGVATGDTAYVLRHGAFMLAVTVVQIAASGFAVYFGARTAMGLGRDLRADLFTQVQRFSATEMDRFGAPSLITRATNDITQIVTMLVMALTMLLTAPIAAIGGLALALSLDVPMTGVLLAAIPVVAVAIAFIVIAMVPASRVMQRCIDGINRVMREHITGIRVIRAFVRDGHEQQRFSEANAELTAASLRVGRVQAFFGATAMMFGNLTSIAIVWIGAGRIADGTMQIGDLIAFLTYAGMILGAVMMSMGVFMMAPRAKVAAGRIREVLDTDPSIANPAEPVTELAGLGELEVEGVTFRYAGAEEAVLRGVDLVARPGQTTAVIGSTGAGKTTLLHLIPRLFDVDAGHIRVDGVDVREMDRALIARTIGLVPQRAYLFSGTVGSNLRYGDPDASDDDLWRALETAQAAGFVRAMPDGLDTVIGQGGTTVSGGQRQRLAIARTLVARPKVYLFDDSFSALDTATDAALRAALARDIADAAQVIVAQRVSTIRDADRIVVLDAGRVAGTGTHEELLAGNAVYAEIVNSQLTLQEAL
ncbi:ABC transporter ATP-binding protein [Glycomyces algeriensis]|uniref:Multidrug ABC transporter ATP-binding protein n=1 Tax=Glycomyces algeriensis TaxID=256037 RepID=A0A9W6LHI2_9ACTN|nr:ABC transporter ATP-binding protein [Glycomyces algeriensis]MDA1364814.1 ABC transporter ATP-binding protein [Glycomyces algeriensis]MDR7350127.1 ATP-binding cassette subfamily B protein [Glycomyces algeriensis]GLI42839.1 multidrug ABC transporter ATP-binding protein [Glycomyces algeriensis]